MKVVAAAATDIGRVREGNEDSYLSDPPLFAVADGMGGHRGGEVASHLALDTLERLFRKGRGVLAEQIQEANRVVFERAQLDRKVAGMGTTLTAASFADGTLRLAHVGDSRAYLLREGTIQVLTEDHTLVHRMVEKGEITEAEADVHPYRSVLTRAVGVDPAVHVDEATVEIVQGDRVLLCSDGLHGMITDDEIAGILAAESDPNRAAEDLIEAANRAGGVDNITVVVLDFVEGDEDPLAQATAAKAREVGPRPRRSRGRGKRVALSLSIAAAVTLVALIGLRVWLDAQWYVGVSDGRVAVYNGIPAEVLWFRLHHVSVVTDVRANDAQHLAPWAGIADGIPANSRVEADHIVERITKDVRSAAKSAAGGGGQGTGSGA